MTATPLAADPTGLTVTKTWTGSAWRVDLAWSGGTAPYTVVAAENGGFDSGVTTLGTGLSSTSLSTAAPGSGARFFAVANAIVVSQAVQGIGYDPAPAPTIPTMTGTGTWWGSDVTLTASYLDSIAKGNIAWMPDLPVRATASSGGAPYATWATFRIPDDARGFYGAVQAHGRSSPLAGSTFFPLIPPGIGPFTNIHAVVWAPQTGRVWVAADGLVQQNDIFLHVPAVVGSPLATWAKPYISRVTTVGKLLVVGGALGVAEVSQIDVSTGDVTHYAYTHDDAFTRSIRPVGIAVDPDGTACYVADATTGKVVRIPTGAGPGGQTITDGWGGRTFAFADAAGMDVNVGHQVVVANNSDGWSWQLTGSASSSPLLNLGSTNVHVIEIDRDSSSSGRILYF